MFVAGSTICFPELPFPEACQALTDLEYDRVEVWLDDASPQLKPIDVARDPEAFVSLYRETTRLTPVGFCLAADVTAQVFEGVSKAAKLLQVTQITVPASQLGTPFNAEIDRLRTLVRIASQDGVRVSIKTEQGHLTEDPQTAVELCGSVQGLGLTLDPSHYLVGPRPVTSFERIAPHVYHVHLRDSTADQLQVPVGLGEIDYSRLISQLGREGYDRASVRVAHTGNDGSRFARLEMRKLRMLLDSLL